MFYQYADVCSSLLKVQGQQRYCPQGLNIAKGEGKL